MHIYEAFICRAYVAELLVVSGVCVVRVACAFIAAVMLAVLDVEMCIRDSSYAPPSNLYFPSLYTLYI